ncbi:hypothetical protein SDC9_75823 [bioreactor metagenome]|uniref:Uncharacterized protein n=1 Tax=bioreactor metagenome TaxID=1076179 RepID=A0A644YS39_9ZZZZ
MFIVVQIVFEKTKHGSRRIFHIQSHLHIVYIDNHHAPVEQVYPKTQRTGHREIVDGHFSKHGGRDQRNPVARPEMQLLEKFIADQHLSGLGRELPFHDQFFESHPGCFVIRLQKVKTFSHYSTLHFRVSCAVGHIQQPAEINPPHPVVFGI